MPQGGPRQFGGLGQKSSGIRRILRLRLRDHWPYTPPVVFEEIANVDASAKVLFEDTVRPVCRIEASATRIHGHSALSLADSPPFWEVYADLLEALWGRRVIVYNASYDRRIWGAEVRSLGARGALAGELPPWECAMRRYAAYVGEPSKRGGYRSQKLPGGDHSALGDALATLRLIEEMATGRVVVGSRE